MLSFLGAGRLRGRVSLTMLEASCWLAVTQMRLQLTSRQQEMEEKPAAKPVQRCSAEVCDSTNHKRREIERCAVDADVFVPAPGGAAPFPFPRGPSRPRLFPCTVR